MSPTSNWLSFSLSPMEMLRSSSHDQSHQAQPVPYENPAANSHFLLDSFYTDGWANQKPQAFHPEIEGNQTKEVQAQALPDSLMLNSFIDLQAPTPPAPKLEDFLGYSDSQTETQDSSLTQIYDPNVNVSSAYFNEQQDLKAFAAFQAFSANSGSEVEDSASMGKGQIAELVGQSIESAGADLGFTNCASGVLSLGVNDQSVPSDKALVPVDDDGNKKMGDTFGQRTSIYRGVTRHRWTGRYEAHLWDNSCRREGQARKGRQVYLGGYDKEDKAARAYDLAALKYWGPNATTNFPISNYAKELEEMKNVTKQEFIASLRRKSSGFSRGASIYRGVTRHHQQGRWQARIGRVAGNKDLYLGTFATEEEAAEAYDIAAIKFRGTNAVTNFEMSRYDVEAIMNSPLPIGGAAKRLRLSLETEENPPNNNDQQPQSSSGGSNINFASVQPVSTIPCGIPYDVAPTLYHQNLLQYIQPNNIGVSNAPPSAVSMAAPVPVLPQPSEFFMWPHQPYQF